MEAIRMLIAFVAHMDIKIYQMDVKSAFVNDFLQEEVCVKEPLEFEISDDHEFMYILDKTLYIWAKESTKSMVRSLIQFPFHARVLKGKNR